MVKLLKNWRSHKAILDFPNQQFYGNNLETCADPTVINSLLRSDTLVNSSFPVVFHSMSGKDEREASSPSFFNRLEALQVKQYVAQLTSDRRLRLGMSK